MSDRLFDSQKLDYYLRKRERKMIEEINHLPPDEIRGTNLESLVSRFTDEYRLTTPVLDESNKEVDHNSPVPGEPKVLFAVLIPYKGDMELFRCQPRVPNPVEGGILLREHALELRFVLSTADEKELMRQFAPHLEWIKRGLAKVEHEVLLFNDALPRLARQHLQARQEHLTKHDRFTAALPSLGFQLKRRNDGSEQVIIPVRQKRLPVTYKPATAQASEPILTLENLDEILNKIDAMIHVMERSPRVFREMKEEDLRTILLVGLNGLFEGGATGETFNSEGRADILIRLQDVNIFIAECLIWHGPEHFRGKLDTQLFQYATWRDEQLVAIVFNRNKNFSEVIEKIREVVRIHDQCLRELDFDHRSGCRALFKRADDAAKSFNLTAIAYDVPS